MQANSRQISSKQQSTHPKLPRVLRRHLETAHRAQASPYSRQAYRTLVTELQAHPRPLVLDSFCGTGHSTAVLAAQHPDHLVVGVDKSAKRLAKHPGPTADNCLLLRTDCESLWQLLAADGLTVDYHYLLYPNPWPKPGHLQRRIHGHASFPLLLQLGGRIELRSNWQVYVEEFGLAMHLAGHRGRVGRVAPAASHISLFEQKYRQSGHELWSYTGHIMP